MDIKKPEESWQQFVELMPKGKAPTLKDVVDRWNEWEDVKKKSNGGEMIAVRTSKDNGEQRLYQAFALGVMEPEERLYVSMLTLRSDQLVLMGVVPVLRDLAGDVKDLREQNVWLKNEMAALRQRLEETQRQLTNLTNLSGGATL
jgi:hypothetical protein